MEKYIIDKEEFKLYYFMLKSDDLVLIKEGIQKLSDSFAKGRYILNSDKSKFLEILEKLLKDKKYIQIHKWIYKCTCFYCNASIEKLCIDNFFSCCDVETRNWIISTIASRYYDKEKFLNKIDTIRRIADTDDQLESLDNKNILYNASIFGHFDVDYDWKNIGDYIYRVDDRNGMYWMAKLFAYPELARKKKLGFIIRNEELDMLTCSQDKEIQTYAYWGMVHRADGKLSLKQEESKQCIKSSDCLKWYYAGIIPGEYINRNYEFIEDILRSACEEERNNFRSKEGILIGIASIPYTSHFDSYIIEWYYKEHDIKIKIKLMEYMIKNVNENSRYEQKFSGFGSFFTIIQDECVDAEIVEYIKLYINVHKTLIYKEENDSLVLGIKKEEKNMSENTINGGNFYGTVIMENKEKIVQVDKTRMEYFLKLLDDFEKECTQQNLLEECKEIRVCVEKNSSNMMSRLITFESHLANFITIISGAPQVKTIVMDLIDHINNLIP